MRQAGTRQKRFCIWDLYSFSFLMFDFHLDRKRYFDIQRDNASEYVIPFIEERFEIKAGMRVLEIGCGEGGVMKAFIDRGCVAVGENWTSQD